MAVNPGDILQIVDRQTLEGERMLNVSFYEVVSAETLVTLQDIADAYDLTVVDAQLDCQVDDVVHNDLTVKNLTDGFDIWIEPLTGRVGVLTGDYLPSLVAGSLRLVRSTGATRHGAKRVGGVAEGDVTGNVLVAGAVTRWNALATAYATPLEATGTVDHDFVANPVIIGRFPMGDPNEGQLDLSVVNAIASGQFIRISSQTSRRVGRGV